MTQAAGKDMFNGIGRALGRAAVACACADSLATSLPVGAREPTQIDPAAATNGLNELAQSNPNAISLKALGGVPKAVGNMRPGNRFVQTLAAIASGLVAVNVPSLNTKLADSCPDS